MIIRGGFVRFVALGSAGLLVGACQGGGAPAASISPVTPTRVTATGPPTRTPTGTPSAPPSGRAAAAWALVPTEARARTFAGAQAFAEFYMRRVNKAWQTPDPQAIRPYAMEVCRTCRNFEDAAADLAEQRRRYADAPFTLTASAWLPESQPDRAVVDLILVQNVRAIVDEYGDKVQAVPNDRGVSRFVLRWRDGRWSIESVKLVVSQ